MSCAAPLLRVDCQATAEPATAIRRIDGPVDAAPAPVPGPGGAGGLLPTQQLVDTLLAALRPAPLSYRVGFSGLCLGAGELAGAGTDRAMRAACVALLSQGELTRLSLRGRSDAAYRPWGQSLGAVWGALLAVGLLAPDPTGRPARLAAAARQGVEATWACAGAGMLGVLLATLCTHGICAGILHTAMLPALIALGPVPDDVASRAVSVFLRHAQARLIALPRYGIPAGGAMGVAAALATFSGQVPRSAVAAAACEALGAAAQLSAVWSARAQLPDIALLAHLLGLRASWALMARLGHVSTAELRPLLELDVHLGNMSFLSAVLLYEAHRGLGWALGRATPAASGLRAAAAVRLAACLVAAAWAGRQRQLASAAVQG